MNVKLKAFAIITIAITIQSCASSKSFQATSSRAPLPDDCKVSVYAPGENTPEKYDVLATVEFGDAGLSTSCGKDIIREAMRVEACKVGANGIIITEEEAPSLWSTCYRASAELVYANR